jgi:bacterioferritin (cytochrome b1)
MDRDQRLRGFLRKLAAEADNKPKPSDNGGAAKPAAKPAAAQKPAQKPAQPAGGQAAQQQQDPGQDLVGGLQQAYEAETFAVLAFTSFASCATGAHRAYMSKFWCKEAHEELDHAKAVGEKICALGGTPTPTTRPMPDARTAQAMIQAALQLEQEAVQLYSQLAEQAGAAGQNGIKAFLEEILVDEQKHLDNLTLMAQDYEHNDPNNTIGQQVQSNFQSLLGAPGVTRQSFPPQAQMSQQPQGQPQAQQQPPQAPPPV